MLERGDEGGRRAAQDATRDNGMESEQQRTQRDDPRWTSERTGRFLWVPRADSTGVRNTITRYGIIIRHAPNDSRLPDQAGVAVRSRASPQGRSLKIVGRMHGRDDLVDWPAVPVALRRLQNGRRRCPPVWRTLAIGGFIQSSLEFVIFMNQEGHLRKRKPSGRVCLLLK